MYKSTALFYTQILPPNVDVVAEHGDHDGVVFVHRWTVVNGDGSVVERSHGDINRAAEGPVVAACR